MLRAETSGCGQMHLFTWTQGEPAFEPTIPWYYSWMLRV